MVEIPGDDCPIPSTHDKYFEAEYFLARMIESYHEPFPFQFNLNAFLQALRNVTWMLQSEDRKFDGFADWYQAKQEEMRGNPLLRRFVEARNIVVKRSSLAARSRAESGVFRGRHLKLAVQHDIPAYVPTAQALEHAVEVTVGTFIDEEHVFIGEQVGVRRTWILDELGDEEAVSLCVEAHNAIGALIAEAHHHYGYGGEHTPFEVNMDNVSVLLESDVDPALLEKWPW